MNAEEKDPRRGDAGSAPKAQPASIAQSDSGEAPTFIGSAIPESPNVVPLAGGAAAGAAPAPVTGNPAPRLESITGEFAALVGPALSPGSVLAGRYEILQMLGQGGMGAVYKARDRQVDRLVAVKIIRPDMAANPAILQRFIQELILARQVTHRNVIRIYDIGEGDGIKFITMEYVEGRDLRAILTEKGKLAPEEAVSIVEQIASGLAAAHSEGVIHRDLKPGNIMQDGSGRIVVMDFGLARTVGGDGMTQTGMMLGTMEYMSPEQAKAEELDARSDVYTLGLIFFELLSGQMPFRADSALASLVMRTQQRAIEITKIDATIPAALNNIIAKCLERDPKLRYASSEALVEDLRAWRGGASSKSIAVPPTFPEVNKTPVWKYISAAVAVIAVLVAGGVIGFLKFRGTPTADNVKPVTLLVADFKNDTNDGVFDGTIEPAFGLALEGASFVNSYARGQAQKIVNQIKPGSTLDEANARLVATREGISVVISGAVEAHGSGYRISYKAMDALTGSTIASDKVDASDKSSVLKSVGSLAGKLRSVLGDTTPESVKLAQQETYTSGSLEAAHEYAVAQDNRYKGNADAAVKSYLKAIEIDPNFGSAYAALAAMYNNLGQQEASIKYYNLAMQYADRMTEREKLRTRGGYYLAAMDAQHAIEEFTALVTKYPADTMGHSSLAYAYYLKRDIPKAVEEGRRALQIYPKYVPYRNNVALYLLYASDFQGALKESETVIQENPAYVKAYSTVAHAYLGLGKPTEAAAAYEKMQKVGANGSSLGAAGVADLAMYEGRIPDAIAVLQSGIDQDTKADNKPAAAKKQVMLAEAHLAIAAKPAALAALDRAVALSRDAVLFTAGRVYVEAGQPNKAAPLLAELKKHIESVPQTYAKILEGEIQLKAGKTQDAIKTLQEAKQVTDMWLVRFDLARAYIAAGAFTEADSELDLCNKRRGESTDVFFDEIQTFRFFPPVHYYEGLVKEGQKSGAARDSFERFLALKQKNSPELMVIDARKRLDSAK